MNYSDILNFWFEQLSPNDWFGNGEAYDLRMVEKFIVIHMHAINGELSHWRNEPLGRLAEILIIDQFSRYIYRDDPKAYSSDTMALVLAQEAIRGNFHKNLETNHRLFLYMPFMNSESRSVHEVALKLYSEQGLETNLARELNNKKIIDTFDRYPERNSILGRISTKEEETFLMSKDSYFNNELGNFFQ